MIRHLSLCFNGMFTINSSRKLQYSVDSWLINLFKTTFKGKTSSVIRFSRDPQDLSLSWFILKSQYVKSKLEEGRFLFLLKKSSCISFIKFIQNPTVTKCEDEGPKFSLRLWSFIDLNLQNSSNKPTFNLLVSMVKTTLQSYK